LEKVSPTDMQSLSLPQITDRLTPKDIEIFVSRHGIVTQYALQIKICTEEACWYCPRLPSSRKPANLEYFPLYTIADGNGGWMPLEERARLLQCSPLDEHMNREGVTAYGPALAHAVREAAKEVFLTDKYLPSNVLRSAWSKNNTLVPWRLNCLTSVTNLKPESVREMFKEYSLAEFANMRSRERRSVGTQVTPPTPVPDWARRETSARS
jgi:hypothetical protein